MVTASREEEIGGKKPYTAKQVLQKRRLIRRVVLVCILLIPFFIWLQSLLLKGEVELPISNNVLIFALININVLLVLFVLFLVLRNLAELLFERRVNRLGNKLKTKLIASFLSLTLIPTILLFFVALQFVSTSMDYWFNASIEDSLTESLKLAQSLIQEKEEQVTQMSKGVDRSSPGLTLPATARKISPSPWKTSSHFNQINGPDSLTVITNDRNLDINVRGPQLRSAILPQIPTNVLDRVRADKTGETIIQEIKEGDLVRCVVGAQLGNGVMPRGRCWSPRNWSTVNSWPG
jgi:two-component system, NtrC family, nitrogen regulation sensor histidine kinase NtrY